MFDRILKCFKNSTKEATIIIPGDYEGLLYYYCSLNRTTEVEHLLKKSAHEIDLLYQSGVFFRLAINNECIYILSILLDAVQKNLEQYERFKPILKSILDSSYVSLKVQGILATHISVIYEEHDMLDDICMNFENTNYEYENSNFTLSQEKESLLTMILPLTAYNLKTFDFPYWKKASECYDNKTDFKDALDAINDWSLSDSIYPKAMIIYNYLMKTNNLDYVKESIKDEALTASYLHIVSSIAILSDNYIISQLINGYYSYNFKKEDSDVTEDIYPSYYDHTDCDTEVPELSELSSAHLLQYRLSGDSYDDSVLIN